MLIAEHILWLGSILETLDLAIVTPHTAHPRGETEKETHKLLIIHKQCTNL